MALCTPYRQSTCVGMAMLAALAVSLHLLIFDIASTGSALKVAIPTARTLPASARDARLTRCHGRCPRVATAGCGTTST